jgi:hypothetical protein
MQAFEGCDFLTVYLLWALTDILEDFAIRDTWILNSFSGKTVLYTNVQLYSF